ncbi:inositol polyphosphate phosphatase [Klebsormidium nitens]|uniref:Inositol polyphosphate phosphatase n=1 Tax=Klebsormidium nitens TaxID=105231 RepID=A0A1Y1HVU2_KLENI|nr:inositol polyphosphate phosphatase [Klebsormidium nitens]|eukprot:GAQ81101.1 inositol polyphosphate phosphatase [Klebsormidium nitens]
MPPHRLPELLGIGPSNTFCDLYAIGVQEAPSIGIELQVLATLGEDYKKLVHVSLASIHLTLFVKKELASEMSDIHTDRVATGVAAFFGNKGGVAAAFTYRGTTFLFVTCHLAAHQDAVLERNDQFGRISRTLFVKERDWARRVNQERVQSSSPRSPRTVRSPPPQTALSSQPAASLYSPGTSSPGTNHSSHSSESATLSGAATYRSVASPSQRDSRSEPHANVTGNRMTEIQPTGFESSPLSPHFTPGQITDTRKAGERVGNSSVAGVPPEPSVSSEALLKPHVADDFDIIVWSGDLNYRVEGNRRVADAALEQNLLEVLRANDQLLREKQAGNAFQGYEEGDLSFTPTYKFDDRSQRYDSSTKVLSASLAALT